MLAAPMADEPKKSKRPTARFRSAPPPAPASTPPLAPEAVPATAGSEPPSGRALAAPRRTRGRAPASTTEGAVLVTGICGRLGKLLARTLHRDDDVVGIDRRAFEGKPKDIVHHQFDLRRKKTRDVFRAGGIRAVVHLGVMHDPRASDKEHHSWNVRGFQKLLDYLAEFEIPKLVVLSSANVYGPQPENPQFLTEEAPLLGAQTFSAIRDLVEVDMLAQSFFWRHPTTETVILRPCHILGSVRNAPSNYLRLARPLTVLGYDPMVQVVHERDVVDALVLALRPGVRGIFNLRGPGEVPLSRLFRMLGRAPVAVPGPLAEAALTRLWKLRLTSFPTPELDHIRYLCMVDDARARTTLGYVPRRSLEETVHAVDSER
jgi:UDP-glucose 4-epimerase